MDPNLFHLDWERTFEALMMIIILAFVVERALAVVFENRLFIERFDRTGVKETIALAVSVWACYFWKFDAISIFILTEDTTIPGYFVTGAVIAGGSKASIKLFHDVLDIKSSAFDRRYEIQAERAAEDAAKAADDASGKTSLAAVAKDEKVAKKAVSRAAKAARASGSLAAADSLARAVAAQTIVETAAERLRSPT